MRVAKMEVFELKSAESVRSNTVHREGHALEGLQAENKAQAAELAKLRCGARQAPGAWSSICCTGLKGKGRMASLISGVGTWNRCPALLFWVTAESSGHGTATCAQQPLQSIEGPHSQGCRLCCCCFR